MTSKYMKVAGTLVVFLGAVGVIFSGNFSPSQWYNSYKQNAAVAADLKTIRAVAPDYSKLSVTIDADSGTVKVYGQHNYCCKAGYKGSCRQRQFYAAPDL